MSAGAKSLMRFGTAGVQESLDFDEQKAVDRLMRAAADSKSALTRNDSQPLKKYEALPPSAALYHYVMKSREKHCLNREVFRHVVLEDEWQIASCASLPFTLCYFLVFFVFCHFHYDVTTNFLAESTLREALSSVVNVNSPMEIFDWMEQVYFPFMWSFRSNNESDSSEFWQVQSGVMLTISRNKNGTCADPLASSMYCYSLPTEQGSTGNPFMSRVRRLLSKSAYAGFTPVGQHHHRHVNIPPTELRRHRKDRGGRNVAKLPPSGNILPRMKKKRGGGSWRSASPIAADHEGELEDTWASGPIELIDQVDEDPLLLGLPAYAKHSRHEHQRRLEAFRMEYSMAGILPTTAGGDVSSLAFPTSWNLSQVYKTMTQLKDLKLFGPETRTFSMEALLLNGNLGPELLSDVHVEFIFSRGGGIYSRVSITTMDLTPPPERKLVLLLVGIYIMYLAWITFSNILKTIVAKRDKHLCRHVLDFWNLLDYLVVAYGWLNVLLFANQLMLSAGCSTLIKAYHADRAALSADLHEDYDRGRFTELLEIVASASFGQMYAEIAAGQYMVILVVRFFQASRGQPRLATVATTIRKAMVDLIHLFFVFIIIFAAFTISGHILFGRRMSEFATIVAAGASLLEICYEREFQWSRFSDENFFTAFFWVFSFVVLVVIIIVNIFLAIVLDTYAQVNINLSQADTLLDTAKHLARRVRHLSSWVPSSQLKDFLINADDNILPTEIIEALPEMPFVQLEILNKRAEVRMNNLLSYTTKAGLKEIISSSILGLLDLQVAAPGLMDEIVFARERRASERKEQAHSTTSASSQDFVAKSRKSLEKQAKDELLNPITPKVLPEKHAEQMELKAQLIPHLEKQAEGLDQATSYLASIEKSTHRRNMGSPAGWSMNPYIGTDDDMSRREVVADEKKPVGGYWGYAAGESFLEKGPVSHMAKISFRMSPRENCVNSQTIARHAHLSSPRIGEMKKRPVNGEIEGSPGISPLPIMGAKPASNYSCACSAPTPSRCGPFCS